MGDDGAKFAELSTRPYADQAQWYLNGFWKEDSLNGPQAEHVWDVVHKFIELDINKGAEGNELNEFDSHRLLEKYEETLSAIKMREALREIDQDNNQHMSCIEYLVWHNKKTVSETVNSPQGDNQEKIAECQRKIAEVQAALADVMAKAEANRQKIEEQKAAIKAQQEAIAATEAAIRELEAAIRELEAKEAELAAAQAELEAALAELKAQEDAYNSKIAELEAKSTDSSIGIVTRNKAANELAQLKGEDPLPLRKAKITQEAAIRRVEKAQKEVAAQKDEVAVQKEAVEAKKREQEEQERALQEVQRQLEAAQAELEAAQAELEVKVEEAVQELEKVKAAGGISHGNLWWMGRELYKADESLSRAKQRYDHSKPYEYTE